LLITSLSVSIGDKVMQLLESGLKVKEYVLLRRNFSETGWSCYASWLITRGAPLNSEEAFLSFLSCSSVAMMITVPTESLFFLGLLNL
jgi:hypothetical protein